MDERSKSNDTAINIMIKMGYRNGVGLGKNESGILEPIALPSQYDKRGFGRHFFIESHSGGKFTPPKYQVWNGDDNVDIREEMKWIESQRAPPTWTSADYCKWIKSGATLTSLANETRFCDEAALKSVLQTKEDVFADLQGVDLSHARMRANQFETIKSAFFMNRAALKMANIDAATNFMFTDIDRDPNHQTDAGPYYFADVCAGPGGFSEYILWRKKWNFKGFGFTLQGVHDFKVGSSTCASDITFRGYYGRAGDGNIYNPANIADFTSKVLHETEQQGVHFMMADGGFSVEGNEGIQEILSKQIYVCQCLVALEIVRKHGHFVTKLFDMFTSFSVGLIYLMYHCFEKVAILKPNASRPANSERYFICKGRKDALHVAAIRDYFRIIVQRLWNDDAILEIIPPEIIQQDAAFYTYIRTQNTMIAQQQVKSLEKLAAFHKNADLIDSRQIELKSKCLKYWRIPDRTRGPHEKISVDDLLQTAISKPEVFYVQPRIITKRTELEKQLSDIGDWIYVPLTSTKQCNSCHVFVGLNESTAYRLENSKWVKVKGLKLAKGTILYGEVVIEHCTPKIPADSTAKSEKRALHIIDALRLGDISLADLNFNERMPLIRTYCNAVNFETAPGKIMRVRAKEIQKLVSIQESPIIFYAMIANEYYTMLPCLGMNSFRETFFVNSILLLKTNGSQSFNTTYVLRAQIYIEKCHPEDVSGSSGLRYDVLLQYVAEKLKNRASNVSI